jgi:hypothetical protein
MTEYILKVFIILMKTLTNYIQILLSLNLTTESLIPILKIIYIIEMIYYHITITLGMHWIF